MGVFLIIFAILGMPTTIFSILNRKRSAVSAWFTLLCACNIVWVLLYALEFLIPDVDAALFLQNCKFVFISADSVFVYLVVLNVLRKRQINNTVVFGMLSFPLCTLIVCITDAMLGTKLLAIDKQYVLLDGIRVIVEKKGIWFWVHCIYCYALLSVAIVMMIRYYFRMPRKYRMSVSFLMFGMMLTMVMTVLAIIQALPYRFDPGPLAAILAQNFYYFAVYFPHSIDLLMSSREAVFENAAYPILVLDNNNSIVDYNTNAGKVGAQAGISLMKGSYYFDFLAKWLRESEAKISEDNPSIFTIHEEKGDVHFEIMVSEMYSESQKGKIIGTYVEIKNITPTMMLVHRLQNEAYFDELTGLYNRNYYSHVSRDFDRFQYFPLGVLVGDLNNLKTVNDAEGHIQGDVLLQKIAAILNECKPSNSVVFRIGGDEFLALTPNADMTIMSDFVQRVRARCMVAEGDGYSVSIALGYQLKTDFSRTIQQVVHEADLAMYRDKYDRRR